MKMTVLKIETMKILSACLASAISIMLLPSCTERIETKPDIMPALLDAIECDRRSMTESMQRVVDTENKDQENHSPASYELVPVVMRNPGKGYHGPTKGSYIFIVEEYPSEEAAARRAAEYLDPGYRQRIANPDSLEEEGKSSVRCWGIAEGKSAYLLTTHAVHFRALESLTHDIERKLTEHISGETGR
jgi:hypothetical protein